MSEEELMRIVNIYWNEGRDFDKRVLELMARDIERETRQRCVSMAYDLANAINNLKT